MAPQQEDLAGAFTAAADAAGADAPADATVLAGVK